MEGREVCRPEQHAAGRGLDGHGTPSQPQVVAHTDETGTRYGVDTGTLAEPSGQQFINYTEDSPKDWRSGFAILTIHNGQLLQPELAKVHAEGEIDFRGTIVRV